MTDSFASIPSPSAGDILNERFFDRIVDRVNQTGKKRHESEKPPVRWAVTVKDVEGNYPDRADDPFVFPFQFIDLQPNDSAPSDLDLPIRDADTSADANPDHWESAGLEKANADDEPDGYAINRLAHHEYPDSFGNEKRKNAALYIPERSIVLIISVGGSHYILRRPAQLRHVEALVDGTPAQVGASTTCNPFKCKSLHMYWAGEHPSLFTAPSDVTLAANASATEELYVHNTSSGTIPQGTRFIAIDFGDGVWVPVISSEGTGGSGAVDNVTALIMFNLTEDMGATTAGQASASVVDVWGDQTSTSQGSTITVHDDGDVFTHAISGCRGMAVLDSNSTDWMIIWCQTTADRISATLASSDDGSSTTWGASPEHSTVKIEAGYTVLSPGPNTYLPSGLNTGTIANPYKLYAPIGAKCILELDESDGSYYLSEVEHSEPWIVFGTVDADRSISSPGNTIDITPTAAIGGPKPAAPLTVRDAAFAAGAMTGNALGVVADDWVVASYDRDQDEWSVIQAANHPMGFLAITTQVIPGGGWNVASPGSGTVKLQRYDGSNAVAVVIGGSNQQVTALNMSEIDIPSDTYVWVQQDGRGDWWITAQFCKAL